MLGPALANHLGVSASWSGWFIAALGGGSVVGSLRRSKHLPSLRLAATALALLGGCMVFFVMTPWVWVSVAAALGAGIVLPGRQLRDAHAAVQEPPGRRAWLP